MRRALLLFVVLTFIPRAAWPQGNPVGPEFRVNTYTTSDQFFPSVASDSLGNFVVVWSSYAQDGSSTNVVGQRYTSSGAPAGTEFRVNTYTMDFQYGPAVAPDASGNFVVVWQSFDQDGASFGVFGQRYGSSGAPLGPEFRVNTYTSGSQFGATVAAHASGSFVVCWTSGRYGSVFEVFGQRYANTGAPIGPEFRVNSYTAGLQYAASVVTDPAGNFVVVWQSNDQDGSDGGIFGQRYASSGAPLGAEFRINTYTSGVQSIPSVALDNAGNFVVVWQSDKGGLASYGIFGQRYAASGAPLGPEFSVDSYTTATQHAPLVAMDSSGNFVVVWESFLQDGSGRGVFGQRFAASGSPLGAEFRVNSYTPNDQWMTSVAADPTGNFVVVWMSNLQDGSGYGVFGQRYNQILPVELMHFRVE